jgi:hypothetical protein
MIAMRVFPSRVVLRHGRSPKLIFPVSTTRHTQRSNYHGPSTIAPYDRDIKRDAPESVVTDLRQPMQRFMLNRLQICDNCHYRIEFRTIFS